MENLHYNINHLRIELWNDLKERTNALVDHPTKKQEERIKYINDILDKLTSIEQYFVFPGVSLTKQITRAVHKKELTAVKNQITDIVALLVSNDYRNHSELRPLSINTTERSRDKNKFIQKRNYFEVLYVEDLSSKEETYLKQRVRELRDHKDALIYDLVVQHSFQDALICLFFNYNIQSVVIRSAPLKFSKNIVDILTPFVQNVLKIKLDTIKNEDLGPLLGHYIQQFRPEIDIYYITDKALTHLDDVTLKSFRRIFYRMEDLQELHLTIISGINERFETPFFNALKAYSKRPISVFHAMPISRGNSVFESQWISDFGDFYGRNTFLAETSATNGGLDSLLQPTGTIKLALDKAAKAFGAKHTFFVTNGTSTANKIVQQALIRPGDVVLVGRDCHKSHHYGLVLSGANPAYLDSYPIQKYSMYGAIPLEEIENKLIELKKAGRIDNVKILLLTNCTFDGLVYNVERVMERVLAIKPDIVFLWDEAWFAFAGFTYRYKQRTGMFVAQKLYKKYKTEAYRKKYKEHIASLKADELPKLPDPDKVKIRVYSTQSTHKTLSSFRQGSMIHIWDESFSRLVADPFQEAYMTHTTTSANYQILASLDVARRQMELEGYELVEKSVELAMVLRSRIKNHPKLNEYFHLLTNNDLILSKYRTSGTEEYYSDDKGWDRLDDAWEHDEFVLDPTKLTLSVAKAGFMGDVFKNEYLMNRFNIQINKTSRNTILLMTNIGTTRGSITYLTNVLLQIADEITENQRSLNKREKEISDKHVKSLIHDVPPLPDFSEFHSSFLSAPGVPGGNIREAFFLGYEDELCEYILLEDCLELLSKEHELVSTSFVIPYPPGFPVLVPGQVVSKSIIRFMIALDVKEIHGYRADLGLKVFTKKALGRKNTVSAMGAIYAINSQNK